MEPEHPTDLAKIGETIIQIIQTSYPKNKENRSFQPGWFQKFEWLEYSRIKDAAFCYPCRQTFKNKNKENAFTTKGFNNWKCALDPNKGFNRHQISTNHQTSMSIWKEKKKVSDDSINQPMSNLAIESSYEKYRYYLSAIIEVIQFIVTNELSLRGDYDYNENEERNLFLNLFNFSIKKDAKLAEIVKIIPQNAKYTSSEIQNELIDIMAKYVQQQVVDDINNSDVSFYTLLEDGTTDKNYRENISICIRYIKNGEVVESLLTIQTISALDAKSFTQLTLKILRDCGIKLENMISQCYDGASVMSGKTGGVQALIQKELNRNIPYVHCFNHKLHLVVVKTMSSILSNKHFFDQMHNIYQFFRRPKIMEIYHGKHLHILL